MPDHVLFTAGLHTNNPNNPADITDTTLGSSENKLEITPVNIQIPRKFNEYYRLKILPFKCIYIKDHKDLEHEEGKTTVPTQIRNTRNNLDNLVICEMKACSELKVYCVEQWRNLSTQR